MCALTNVTTLLGNVELVFFPSKEEYTMYAVNGLQLSVAE